MQRVTCAFLVFDGECRFGVDEALLQKVVLYNKAPPRNETMEG